MKNSKISKQFKTLAAFFYPPEGVQRPLSRYTGDCPMCLRVQAVCDRYFQAGDAVEANTSSTYKNKKVG